MDKFAADAAFPLSPMQQGMLFHSLYNPRSGVNVEQIVGTLHHPLDASVFRQAWEKTVERHPILRASFHWEGLKTPMQEIHSDVKLPFEMEDWRSLSEDARKQKLDAYLKAGRCRGFVLNDAPLMRLALFHCGEDDFQFVWTFYHAVLDGRSFAAVLNDVFAFYDAILQKSDLELPPPRPFRDYIEWLCQQDFSRSEPFWRDQLKGFHAPTPFVVDRPASADANRTVEYGEASTRLSLEATNKLRELSTTHGLGLATIVYGAWALLLGRYSGEEDVLFGSTRACRQTSIEGAESIAGIFINTVPFRANINPDAPALDWLKKLREQQNQIRLHENTPLLDIQKWSELPVGAQLFDSILIFDRATLDTALRSQGGDWEKRHFRAIDQTNFPLTVFGYAEPELSLKMEFDESRFEPAVIERMLGHLQTLLEVIAANPNGRLSALPMLTAAERRQLLTDWNQTQAAYPRELCVHEVFEAQAARTPDEIALVFEEEQLTWSELNFRADQLAGHLQKLGVGPDVLTGICVERSLDMVIGMLGILKAGGAYVPLDPTYPHERLEWMISDSKMPVLLTHTHLLSQLPEHSARVVCLDTFDLAGIDKIHRNGNSPRSANLA